MNHGLMHFTAERVMKGISEFIEKNLTLEFSNRIHVKSNFRINQTEVVLS